MSPNLTPFIKKLLIVKKKIKKIIVRWLDISTNEFKKKTEKDMGIDEKLQGVEKEKKKRSQINRCRQNCSICSLFWFVKII